MECIFSCDSFPGTRMSFYSSSGSLLDNPNIKEVWADIHHIHDMTCIQRGYEFVVRLNNHYEISFPYNDRNFDAQRASARRFMIAIHEKKKKIAEQNMGNLHKVFDALFSKYCDRISPSPQEAPRVIPQPHVRSPVPMTPRQLDMEKAKQKKANPVILSDDESSTDEEKQLCIMVPQSGPYAQRRCNKEVASGSKYCPRHHYDVKYRRNKRNRKPTTRGVASKSQGRKRGRPPKQPEAPQSSSNESEKEEAPEAKRSRAEATEVGEFVIMSQTTSKEAEAVVPEDAPSSSQPNVYNKILESLNNDPAWYS